MMSNAESSSSYSFNQPQTERKNFFGVGVRNLGRRAAQKILQEKASKQERTPQSFYHTKKHGRTSTNTLRNNNIIIEKTCIIVE